MSHFRTLILTHTLEDFSINPSRVIPLCTMIPIITYKLVTPNLPPAPDLFVQLHDRHSHLVVHSQLKHTVSKMNLSFSQLFLKQFYNHSIFQKVILEFMTDVSSHLQIKSPMLREWGSTILFCLKRMENGVFMNSIDD